MTRDTMLSLEDALAEASNMANVLAIFIGSGLGFEENRVPHLTVRQCELVYFLANRTASLAEEAMTIFDKAQGMKTSP